MRLVNLNDVRLSRSTKITDVFSQSGVLGKIFLILKPPFYLRMETTCPQFVILGIKKGFFKENINFFVEIWKGSHGY